jgi:hypothetical protein
VIATGGLLIGIAHWERSFEEKNKGLRGADSYEKLPLITLIALMALYLRHYF